MGPVPGHGRQRALLVHIHGGYWQRNSREVFACLAEGVAQHGWSAALPGYTLAPEASLAGIVAELRLALDWLQNHGATYSIGGPIILSGWSAGGHLAALLLEHPVIAAGLAISGVYELGPIRDTYLNEKLRLTDEEIARCRRPVWRNQRGRSTSPTAQGVAGAGGQQPRAAHQARRLAPSGQPCARARPRSLHDPRNIAPSRRPADTLGTAFARQLGVNGRAQ